MRANVAEPPCGLRRDRRVSTAAPPPRQDIADPGAADARAPSELKPVTPGGSPVRLAVTGPDHDTPCPDEVHW